MTHVKDLPASWRSLVRLIRASAEEARQQNLVWDAAHLSGMAEALEACADALTQALAEASDLTIN